MSNRVWPKRVQLVLAPTEKKGRTRSERCDICGCQLWAVDGLQIHLDREEAFGEYALVLSCTAAAIKEFGVEAVRLAMKTNPIFGS